MSDCGRYVKKSSYNGLSCMKKGIEVGNHIKLPPEYSPMDAKNELSRAQIYCESGSPYLCFKKGFAIGKKINMKKKNSK